MWGKGFSLRVSDTPAQHTKCVWLMTLAGGASHTPAAVEPQRSNGCQTHTCAAAAPPPLAPNRPSSCMLLQSRCTRRPPPGLEPLLATAPFIALARLFGYVFGLLLALACVRCLLTPKRQQASKPPS